MEKSILLVDDEVEIVNFMESFLKRFKIHSIKATSGDEALRLYDKEKVGFVLLDIHMKGLDGFDVLKGIRKVDPDARIIMLSGSTDKEALEKAKSLGALDYIAKPIELADLKNKVKKYMLSADN